MDKRALADKARAAMLQRIETGEPFHTADLTKIGVAAGQSSGTAGNTASNLIQSMKPRVAKVGEAGHHGPNLWQMKDPRPSLPPELIAQLSKKGQEKYAPLPVPVAPNVVGPYDPDPKREGRNMGLTEQLADKLWRLIGGADESADEMAIVLKPLEADGWRRLSLEVQTWMFDCGFVGPGGPRKARDGYDYAWVYACGDWAIQDSSGGHVALISDDQDVPLFLAAPRMRDAITTLLQRFEERGGIKRADLADLAASLPSLD